MPYDAYDLTDYEGFSETGGVRVKGGRVRGIVRVRGVQSEELRTKISTAILTFAATLSGKEIMNLDTGGENMRLEWAYRDQPTVVTQAQVAHLEGEAAACVAFIRWGGGR